MNNRPPGAPMATALTLILGALILGGCQPERPPVPLPAAPGTAAARPEDALMVDGPSVRSTIVEPTSPPPPVPQAARVDARSGDIQLNFPGADVRVAAKAILGDLLRLPYSVDPAVNATVSVVTAAPIARGAVLELFERSLRASNLGLVPQGDGFLITTTSAAGGGGPIAPDATGYGSEVVTLQYISADEMKRLLDSVLPGTVTSTDPAANRIVIAGTTGQRASVRDILRQFDVNWLRNMAFALFIPQRTDARLIAPELDKLINDPSAPTRGLVRLIAMDRLNGVLAISAQPAYLEDVRRWVEILDRESENNERQLFVYRVQNGRARDLARTLNTAFGVGGAGGGAGASGNPDPFAEPSAITPPAPPQGAAGPEGRAGDPGAATPPGGGAAARGRDLDVTISADETNNAIIVYGLPRDYAVVEKALRTLDTLPYQVLIEAAITEVGLTDNLRYGVQWNFQTGSSNFALTEGTNENPTRVFPGFSYFYSGSDISATLNALEERTTVKVISAPKLLVLNNQTAALQVGDQVPVSTQSSVGTNSGDSPVINSIEYRDTGVILKVTPRVNASGLVLLDIAQEVSDVTTTRTSGIDSPTISTRRISTSVAVQDGQVIALGGLFRDSKSFGKNGLPILSRIPVLGALFGKHDNSQDRTELLVIIKPHVLRTIDDGRAVTEELRSKLRTLEPFRTEGRIP